MSVYKEQVTYYLGGVTASGVVADVGGGSNPIKNLVSYKAKECVVFDNCQEGVFGGVIKFDLNTDVIGQRWKEYFDMVFCVDVFEYVYNPVHAVKQLSKMLRRGGAVYITFPTLYPPHNPVETDYLRYTKRGAIRIMNLCGLTEKEVVPCRIRHQDLYKEYVNAEGYKARGGIKDGTIFDSGYIIYATKP